MLTVMNFWTRRTRTSILIVVWLLSLTGMPTAAFAQKAAPMPSLTTSPHPLIGFGLIAVFAVAIVAISLLPSKRGHQD